MIINLSENIIDIIDDILTDYCIDYNYPLNASRALGALRNAIANAKDLEELNKKIKEDYPALDTSLADFLEDRINEVILKGVTNETKKDI